MVCLPSGRRLRNLFFILAVGDGEQGVLDEGDYGIRGPRFGEGAGGKQRARVSFRRVWHTMNLHPWVAGRAGLSGCGHSRPAAA